MSAERDAGLAALQSGDTAGAIEQLERACQQDPNDYQAQLYLGAAYGQAGRHMDAVHTLTHAVQLQPANAQARYNLGIAMERAGYPQEALTALQQALTLQPDYPKAQEAIQRLQPTTPQAPASPEPYPPSASTPYAQPEQPSPGLYGQPQPGYAPPGYAQPTQSMPGYGQPQAPGHVGSTYAPGMGLYGQSAPNLGTYVEDKFDIVQAFKDWGRILISPKRFFQEQAGREGMKAPMAMVCTYMLFIFLMTVVALMTGLSSKMMLAMGGTGLPAGTATAGVGLGFVIGLGFCFAILLLIWLIFAGIVHLFGRAFGSRAPYAGSFRAVIYAALPLFVVGLLNMIVILKTGGMNTTLPSASPEAHIVLAQDSSPFGSSGRPGGVGRFPNSPTPAPFGQPGGPMGVQSSPFANPLLTNPINLLLTLVAFVWCWILLGIGVAHIQGLSSAAAAGVVILSVLVAIVLYVVFFIILGLLFAAVVAGAAASSK